MTSPSDKFIGAGVPFKIDLEARTRKLAANEVKILADRNARMRAAGSALWFGGLFFVGAFCGVLALTDARNTPTPSKISNPVVIRNVIHIPNLETVSVPQPPFLAQVIINSAADYTPVYYYPGEGYKK